MQCTFCSAAAPCCRGRLRLHTGTCLGPSKPSALSVGPREETHLQRCSCSVQGMGLCWSVWPAGPHPSQACCLQVTEVKHRGGCFGRAGAQSRVSLAVQAVGRGLQLHRSCCPAQARAASWLHSPGGLGCTFCTDQSNPGAVLASWVSWRVQAPCVPPWQALCGGSCL